MVLRNNQALKFFAILLFSFELLAPAFLSISQVNTIADGSTKNTLSASHTNIYALLAIEEINEEEREGKNLLSALGESYSLQKNFFIEDSFRHQTSFSFDQYLSIAHRPLYRLNRTLLI